MESILFVFIIEFIFFYVYAIIGETKGLGFGLGPGLEWGLGLGLAWGFGLRSESRLKVGVGVVVVLGHVSIIEVHLVRTPCGDT